MFKIDELVSDNAATQELLNLLFEITSEAAWILDVPNGKSVWLASAENKEKFAIRERKENEPDYWIVGLHPEDKAYAVDGFQKALTNPAVIFFEHEYRFQGKDGYIYIHDKMKFCRDAHGIANVVVGVWTDVTDKHFREEKLNQLLTSLEDDRERFRIISEVSNAAMWEVDFITNELRWTGDSQTLKELGLHEDFRPLSEWEKLVHPHDRARAVKYLHEKTLSKETKYFDEYRIVKQDGSIGHMIDRGYIIRDEHGKALRGMGGWIDVTNERNREEELREALDRQEKMNEELSAHEEELASSEEELRQINEQLSINLQILTERDFIITQSQQLARIGSWEFEPLTMKVNWSQEVYNIFGVDYEFDKDGMDEILPLFEENSRPLIVDNFQNMMKGEGLPFDVTAQIKTPIGYKKWIRLTAYQLAEGVATSRIVGLVYDVTYFKESEERLRTSEEKFSKAFRNNPDMMNIVREDDRIILDVNERVCTMLGYTREELIGTSASDLNLYVNSEEWTSFLTEYELSGEVEMECTWRRKDGRHIQVLASSSRLELEGRKCILSVVRDISDRKIAEERFEKAFDLGVDLMLIFREEDSTLVEANSKQLVFSGYTREETIGKSSHDFKLWADDEARKAFLQNYSISGHQTVEALLLKKDGITFFGTVSAQRILLNNENHMLVVVRDITDKKLAEERLIESEANLNATINNTKFLIWSVDTEYRLRNFNDPFRKHAKMIFGVDLVQKLDILSTPWVTTIGDVRALWKERYDLAFKGETVKISDQRGNLYLDISLNPIVDNGKIIGASVFAEDVSDRVLKERELAEALSKIGELKLTALRSVMNPHFIFNALNSIQYFIAQNDRRNAINYLSTFSKLVRGILTNSLNNKIKLAEELEQLRNYVSLEQMRFENKFEFVVQIDEDLDLDAIEIPSLLVQPYVENAILHGLYNKEGKGILNISVVEENDTILFEIEDNGIGRKAAMNLRNQNFPKHKSMGTALTEERLKLINAQDKVSFEIIDLMDKDSRPSGTKVRIWVKG